MIVIGIDQSLSSSAITVYELDSSYEILITTHYFTTSVLKLNNKICDNINPRIINNKLAYFNKTIAVCTHIKEILKLYDEVVVAMEGYSFGSTGRSVFQLGELGGIVRWLCYEAGINVRIYEPPVIKQFATSNGSAGKGNMYLAYKQQYPNSNILKYGTGLNEKLPLDPQLKKVAGKPLCDLVDSHFIAEMLRLEIMLRNGFTENITKKDHDFFSKKKLIEKPYDF